ncbi:type II toxin-antitoxin system RelE/ParE family toxin [Legionella saoudiensis]|uniref:type II toxin-antitoxin system RelE/ParE family toxin n=1 Tax=Legionella saoudiensis TaxID=1750561 RepID=UPI0007313511|nr:type II toxin-antitoxin system RelE/ParE family toxin [Legionella saoudiensis]
MTNKTYRLYPKAIEDLESTYLYSTREFGIKRTEDYIRPDLRAFNVGSHIIFFKTTDYGIAVIRVLHQSMDFNRHL